MEHALACGIRAHRDVKPGNLLIASGSFLNIADFGLALAASEHPAVVDDSPKRPSQLQWLKSADGRLTCGILDKADPDDVACAISLRTRRPVRSARQGATFPHVSRQGLPSSSIYRFLLSPDLLKRRSGVSQGSQTSISRRIRRQQLREMVPSSSSIRQKTTPGTRLREQLSRRS